MIFTLIASKPYRHFVTSSQRTLVFPPCALFLSVSSFDITYKLAYITLPRPPTHNTTLLDTRA
jgi:hypothetical protein